MRKTALEDDAAIYRRERDKSERQKWGEMDRKQRLQYLTDYYLVKFAVGAALLFAVIFLLWHFLKPKNETVLYVAVMDESLDAEKAGQMTEELNRMFGADGAKRKVILDDSFYRKDGALEKLEVYLHSGQIDVIIAEEEVWRTYAGYGFLKDMKRIDEGGKYQEYYCYAAGYRDSDEISFEDHETGMGEERAYGADIAGSRKFMDMAEYTDAPVFAVAEGCENEERALQFLDFLIQD